MLLHHHPLPCHSPPTNDPPQVIALRIQDLLRVDLLPHSRPLRSDEYHVLLIEFRAHDGLRNLELLFEDFEEACAWQAGLGVLMAELENAARHELAHDDGDASHHLRARGGLEDESDELAQVDGLAEVAEVSAALEMLQHRNVSLQRELAAKRELLESLEKERDELKEEVRADAERTFWDHAERADDASTAAFGTGSSSMAEKSSSDGGGFVSALGKVLLSPAEQDIPQENEDDVTAPAFEDYIRNLGKLRLAALEERFREHNSQVESLFGAQRGAAEQRGLFDGSTSITAGGGGGCLEGEGEASLEGEGSLEDVGGVLGGGMEESESDSGNEYQFIPEWLLRAEGGMYEGQVLGDLSEEAGGHGSYGEDPSYTYGDPIGSYTSYGGTEEEEGEGRSSRGGGLKTVPRFGYFQDIFHTTKFGNVRG